MSAVFESNNVNVMWYVIHDVTTIDNRTFSVARTLRVCTQN